MAVDTRSFWQRPLNRRSSHVLVAVLVAITIFLEGWFGRKRLFVAHDRHYLFAFILFIAATLVLFSAFAVVGNWLRTGRYRNGFGMLQTFAGMLTLLAILLVGLFSDYTLSKLDTQSVAESIFTGFALAVWSGVSLKNPEPTEEPQ